jgi:carbamoyl-phosphate synthase large subunit
MNHQRNVLVTAIGSFSADAVIRELKKAGNRVIGCDIYPAEWVAQSRDVDAFYQAPYVSDEEAYLTFLKNLIQKEQISRIVPLIDVEVDLMNRDRDEIETGETRICMSDVDTIELLRNKLELGLKVQGIVNELEDPELKSLVRTIPSTPAEEVDFERVTLPLILKPVRGRSSQGLYRIRQQIELRGALTEIEDLGNYIMQPMLQGNVITVDIVRDHEGHCLAIPREELLRTSNGAGLSVRVFEDPGFQKVVCRIADALGVLGSVNFEFIHGEGSGVYYFIECNPRFSGGVAFTELAGVPVISDHMAVFDGEIIDDSVKPESGFMTRKYLECRM